MADQLLTAQQLADRLNVSVAFVYRYRGPGRIVLSRTLVRFDYDQVARYLETGKGDPPKALRTIGKPRNWRITAPSGFAHGGVYFIQGAEGGPIKIGWSRWDIGRRFQEHQEGSPARLVILATIRNASISTEYQLHSRFEHLRLHGEWFEPGEDLLAYIAELETEAA